MTLKQNETNFKIYIEIVATKKNQNLKETHEKKNSIKNGNFFWFG